MSSEEVQSLERRLERIERKLEEAAAQPKAVKIEEAARLLSCSARHISRMAKKGKIRLIFPLGLTRVPMTEIVRLTSLANDPRPPPMLSPHTYDAKAEAEEARARAKRRRRH